MRKPDGNESWVSGGYDYLTGGTVSFPWSYDNGKMISINTNGQLFNKENQEPLGTNPLQGDSGFPLFAYDTLLQKWVVVGVLSSGGGGGTNWSVVDTSFVQKMIQDDTDAPVTFMPGISPLKWKFDSSTGTGSLTQGSTEYAMHGQNGSDLNAGKNLTFLGLPGGRLACWRIACINGTGLLSSDSRHRIYWMPEPNSRTESATQSDNNQNYIACINIDYLNYKIRHIIKIIDWFCARSVEGM
ncbi:hypothetical protein KSS59_004228 [Escherichia albertii]|nr:hypothetical protein [Escherichia albertii]